MNNFYVYEWIRLDNNEPFYVGKGQGDRCFSLANRNKHFHNIVNKLGMENIAVNILSDQLNEDEAFGIEVYYIEEYRQLGFNLTNYTDGGDGFTGTHSEEARRRMSESIKKSMTLEVRKKIGIALSGEKNGMSIPIIVYKDEKFIGEFDTITQASIACGGRDGNCGVAQALNKILHGWTPPKRSKYKGYKVFHKEEHKETA